MIKLNRSYFKFFFFPYGLIVVLIHLFAIPLSFFGAEKDLAILFCASLASIPFMSYICMSDYKTLQKNLPPATVFLTGSSLIINEKTYPHHKIEKITYKPVRNALDKSCINFIEIKTSDEEIFYFIDRPRNWKLESPTIKLLNINPFFL